MSPFDCLPAAGAQDRLRQAPGGTFAEAAGRLAGRAGVLLGWSPDAFWRATPAELGAVVAALAGDEAGASPPDAGTIAAMREAFPDG